MMAIAQLPIRHLEQEPVIDETQTRTAHVDEDIEIIGYRSGAYKITLRWDEMTDRLAQAISDLPAVMKVTHIWPWGVLLLPESEDVVQELIRQVLALCEKA